MNTHVILLELERGRMNTQMMRVCRAGARSE